MPTPTDVYAVLQERLQREPEAVVVTTLADDGQELAARTLAEVDARARAVAAQLLDAGLGGHRVVIAYPPSGEYIDALLGCLYAGVVAVPAYPPADARQIPRLLALLRDCQAAALVAPEGTEQVLSGLGHGSITTVVSPDPADSAAAEGFSAPTSIGGDAVALLQYTSGSTSTPRGVVVTHGNVLANSSAISERFASGPGDCAVIWLPPYHDMGLTGGILHPLLAGFSQVSMSPTAFLRRPMTWLEALQRYRGTISGGPNFAYDLLVRRTSEEQRAGLDLSSWRVAFCGAEPIQADTARRFSRAFAASGLPDGAFYPCYGLAESTLFVTGADPGTETGVVAVDPEQLELGTLRPATPGTAARELVSSGWPAADHRLRVVDPKTLTPCADGLVGEVWVSGASISTGYFGGPDGDPDFNGVLSDDPGARYLRTGDLGALTAEGLVVTGRMKDLLVVRGRNHYPQDLEATAVAAHPTLLGRCAAAFAVARPGSPEDVVVAVEVPDEHDAAAVTAAVRQAVSSEHGIALADVALLPKGGVPRTSSGKIRRRATRAAYLATIAGPASGADATVAVAVAVSTSVDLAVTAAVDDSTASARAAAEHAIAARHARRQSIRRLVAAVLGADEEGVDEHAPLSASGLDSLRAVELHARLAEEQQLTVDLRWLMTKATVRDLAADPGHGAAARPGLVADHDTDALTVGEAAMVWMQQSDPASTTRLLSHRVELDGPLDVEALRTALFVVAHRHPGLRTRFADVDGTCRRRTDAPYPVLEVLDARTWPEAAVDAAVAQRAEGPMDLRTGPLWRWTLLRRDVTRWQLAVVAHHAVTDLWSFGVLVDEIALVMAGLGAGTGVPELSAPGNPAAVAGDERAWLDAPQGRASAAYWRTTLADPPPSTRVRRDLPPTRQGTDRVGVVPVRVDPSTLQALTVLARRSAATPFSVLLAGFGWLVGAHGGGRDVAVGVPLANRAETSARRLIGYRTNTVPVRVGWDESDDLLRVARRLAGQVAGALTHQRVPYAEIVRELREARPGTDTAEFEVMFALQDGPGWSQASGLGLRRTDEPARWGDVVVRPMDTPPGGPVADLFLELADDGKGGLAGRLSYRADLYSHDTATRLARRYLMLLHQCAAVPSARLDDLDLLGEAERTAVTHTWPATTPDVAPDTDSRLLVDVVRDIARGPAAATEAVVDGDTTLTYRELWQRAGHVARWLHAYGIGHEDKVLVALPRGADTVTALLATWRVDGCYVPVDPQHPAGRIADLVGQVSPTAVITTSDFVHHVRDALRRSGHDPRLPLFETDVACWMPAGVGSAAPDVSTSSRPDPDTAAYVMFTSGSTGRPKPVVVPHRGVRPMLAEFDRRAPLGDDARSSWWTSATFDVSVYEIFAPLSVGGTLVVVPEAVRTDAGALLEWSADQRLTSCYLPPFLLPHVVELLDGGTSAPPLRRLLIGVEPLSRDTAASLRRHLPDAAIVNGYGPTECTVFSGLHTVTDDRGPQRLPIGTGIAGGPVYVLDEHLDVVPVGVPGEICIAGVGVARGYEGHPALTAAAFVPDPFSPGTGGRMYRTGDQAVWLPSGVLEFLGRRDHQVKIRGHRVDPAEIETCLREHPAVPDCRVVARPGPSEEVALVAYVRSDALEAGGSAPDVEDEVLKFARERLPRHLVPAAVVTVTTWPLTTSGKLDRSALPAVDWTGRAAAGEGPATPTERIVADVCARCLKVAEIGRDADFFAVGGHSLLASRVVAELTELLGRRVPLSWLLRYPTVRALAAAVDGAALRLDDDEPALVRVPRGDACPSDTADSSESSDTSGSVGTAGTTGGDRGVRS